MASLIFLGMWILNYRNAVTPNIVIGILTTASDLILFGVATTTCLGLIYRSITNTESLSLIYMLILVLLLVYISICLETYRPSKIISAKAIQSESQWPMLHLVFNAIVLVERADSETSLQQLHVIIRQISAIQMKTKIFGHKVNDWLDQILSLRYSVGQRPEKSQTTLKELCYQVLQEVCITIINQHPKETYARLLHAYIMFSRLNSKWKAIYELEAIMAVECPMIIKISAVRLMSMIEHETKEFEIHSAQNLGIDAIKILYRQQFYQELKELFGKGCETHLLFWQELTDKKPSAEKLQMLGFEIAKSNDLISGLMRDSNNNETNQSLRVLQIYGEYLKLVSNESEDSKRILQRAGNIAQSLAVSIQFDNDKKLRNIENANPSIMIVSGDYKTMGTILQTNNETLKILERKKDKVIGESVELIMPKIYADFHDYWMKRYFETNKGNIMNGQRNIFVINRRGFMVLVNLLVKIIPEVSDGIRVVGIFSELKHKKTDCVVLINASNGHVAGITEECYNLFGIHPSLCYGVAQYSAILNVTQIFPEISSQNDLTLEKLKTVSEPYVLDTSTLENFILASRLENDDLGVPPPNHTLLNKHQVRLMPKPVQTFENTGLSLFELEMEDAIQEAERRGSLIGKGIIAVTSTNKHMVEELFEKIALEKEKTLHKITDNDEDDEDGVLNEFNKDLTEAQIEEMNMKAERERKLKEHRQLLKMRKVPNKIILIYLVSLVAMIAGFTGHSTSLALKNEVLEYFQQDVQAVTIMSKRLSDISSVSFYIAKLKHYLQ